LFAKGVFMAKPNYWYYGKLDLGDLTEGLLSIGYLRGFSAFYEEDLLGNSMSQEKHQELFANRDADSDDSSLWDLLRVKKGDYLVAILSGNEYQIEGLPLSSLALPFDEMPLDGGDKVIRQNDTWGYASIPGSLIKLVIAYLAGR